MDALQIEKREDYENEKESNVYVINRYDGSQHDRRLW